MPYPCRAAVTDPVNNFYYYFAVSLSVLPGGQNQLCMSICLATLAAQPNYSAKKRGLIPHLVTVTQRLPAPVSEARCIYTRRAPSACLSVCQPVSSSGTGLWDLCSISSLAKREKYQIGRTCKTVQLALNWVCRLTFVHVFTYSWTNFQ